MTQSDEQVIEQLWVRLESFEPSEWIYEGEGKIFNRHSYSVVLDGEEVDACHAYLSHWSTEFASLRDEFYKLLVTKRMDNLFRFQEKNPEADSRLVKLYRRVDDYWSPMIPEIQARRSEGRLETLARILGNKE